MGAISIAVRINKVKIEIVEIEAKKSKMKLVRETKETEMSIMIAKGIWNITGDIWWFHVLERVEGIWRLRKNALCLVIRGPREPSVLAGGQVKNSFEILMGCEKLEALV